MTRRISWTTLAAIFALSAFATAGDKAHCTAPVGDCVKATYEKLAKKGWLGIETDKNEKGVVSVTSVAAGSPAATAGFMKGDSLLAINGVELSDANKEALMKTKKSLGPGSQASYTVLRQGAKKTLSATLVAPPQAVIAQWLGDHVIADHVGPQVASK